MCGTCMSMYNLKMCGGVVSEGVRSLCRCVCKCKVCVMYVCRVCLCGVCICLV